MDTVRSKAEIERFLAQAVEGRWIEIWGKKAGDSYAWTVYTKTEESSEWMDEESFDSLAKANGFKDGPELIAYAADYDLTLGPQVR